MKGKEGREGKGREGKGREGKGKEGKGKEWKGRKGRHVCQGYSFSRDGGVFNYDDILGKSCNLCGNVARAPPFPLSPLFFCNCNSHCFYNV